MISTKHIARKVNKDEYRCSCGFGPSESLIPIAEHIKKELKKLQPPELIN